MRTQPFDFLGAEGQTLSGALDLPEGEVKAHAVFAHCFTCTKSSIAAVRIARALAAIGIAVLRYDFTGLGQSHGDFASSTFSGSVSDLAAAALAMRDAGRPVRLLIGHSLGGAAVLAAAGELPEVKAVATIGAPFGVSHVTKLFGPRLDDLLLHGEAEVDIGGRTFRVRRTFLDDLAKHDQVGRIRNLRRPLLVLHAPRDQVVGVANASEIFLAARHPKSFVSLDDADHLLRRDGDAEYAAVVIAAWASRYVGAPAPARSEGQVGAVVVEETGVGGFQVEVSAGNASFLADEPAEVGGLGSGPTPYDLLCAALGACTAMTLRMYARWKGWPLERVRVTVAHVKEAALTPPDAFSRSILLAGRLSPEERARLLEIADRCPVHRTLMHGARAGSSLADPRAPAMAWESPIQHALDAEKTAEAG